MVKIDLGEVQFGVSRAFLFVLSCIWVYLFNETKFLYLLLMTVFVISMLVGCSF